MGGPLEFDEAKRQAEAWLAQLAGSAVRSIKRATVRAALETYLADLRRDGRHDTAREAEGRFKTVILADPMADLRLEEATRDDQADMATRMVICGSTRILGPSSSVELPTAVDAEWVATCL